MRNKPESTYGSSLASQMDFSTRHGENYTQLGFLDVVLGITSAVAVATQSGMSVYGTIEQISLAKEQSELHGELLRERATLESELLVSQQKLADMRATYYGQREEIAIGLERTQADLMKERLRRDALIHAQEQEIRSIEIASAKKEAVQEIARGTKDTATQKNDKGSLIPIAATGAIGVALLAIIFAGKRKEKVGV